jgi:hypothetical protein
MTNLKIVMNHKKPAFLICILMYLYLTMVSVTHDKMVVTKEW